MFLQERRAPFCRERPEGGRRSARPIIQICPGTASYLRAHSGHCPQSYLTRFGTGTHLHPMVSLVDTLAEIERYFSSPRMKLACPRPQDILGAIVRKHRCQHDMARVPDLQLSSVTSIALQYCRPNSGVMFTSVLSCTRLPEEIKARCLEPS